MRHHSGTAAEIEDIQRFTGIFNIYITVPAIPIFVEKSCQEKPRHDIDATTCEKSGKDFPLVHVGHHRACGEFTIGKDGFSNGLFHVDSSHLGAKAIPKIEQQLP